MRLYDYLQHTKRPIKHKIGKAGTYEIIPETNLSRYSRFGKQIGVSLHSIRKYLNGERGIKDRTKRKIVQATEGKVKWQDLVSE